MRDGSPRIARTLPGGDRPALVKEFGYKNVMQAPRLEKVTLNIGLGEAVQNAKALDAASSDIATITGQHPVITRAKKSIANFKLREGMPIGVMVTLRGSHDVGVPGPRCSTPPCPASATSRASRRTRSTAAATTAWAFASR